MEETLRNSCPPAVVFRSPVELDEKSSDWTRPEGNDDYLACVAFRPLCIPDSMKGRMTAEQILVVGNLSGLMAQTRKLATEQAPAGFHYIFGVPKIIDIMGHQCEGSAHRLLSNLLCSVLPREDHHLPIVRKHDEIRRAGYLRELTYLLEAWPGADWAMELAARTLMGQPVSRQEIGFLDESLSHTATRRLCAERELDTEALANALARDGVGHTDTMLARWAHAMFSPNPVNEYPKPLSMDSEALHSLHCAVRAATGEDGGRRPLVYHNQGGCAAFAVILNSLLEGPGRYVVTGDRRLGLCGHVALRVGNHVVDGEGVWRPDAFMRRWHAVTGPADFFDPSPDGNEVRRLAGGDDRMNVAAVTESLREELHEAGLLPCVERDNKPVSLAYPML